MTRKVFNQATQNWDTFPDIPREALTLEQQMREKRTEMRPVSPLQGILTLGETEWGKVLAYRETATWSEKVVIDNAADWVRTSQNIAFFGHLLDYTDEQMDAMFLEAAQVEA